MAEMTYNADSLAATLARGTEPSHRERTVSKSGGQADVERIGDAHLFTTYWPRVFHLSRYRGARRSHETFLTLCGKRGWRIPGNTTLTTFDLCAQCARWLEAGTQR